MGFKKFGLSASALLLAVALSVTAYAADQIPFKIGVMDIQKIMTESQPGIEAKQRIEARGNELKAALEIQQKEVEALKDEIEKKGTVWTKEKKDEKIVEFNKMRRDLKTKSDDANLEMKRMNEKELQPIIKALEGIVEEYGSKNKFALILDSRSSVLYYDTSYDVSSDLIEVLNQKMK